MNETLLQYFSALTEPLTFLANPGKRIYWGYMLSAVLLTFVAFRFAKEKCKSAIQQTFRKKYWLGRNSLLDLKWIWLNQSLAFAILLPLLTGQVAWAMQIYRGLVANFGGGDFIQWSYIQVVGLYTLVIFLSEDFSRFLIHYLYHKVPFLWRFHAIHHSAKIMTPLTLYRVHFVEYVINSCRAVFVTGTISGIFIYCFDGAISVYEVLGVSIFNLLFNLVGANLRHSHIWLGFGKAENVFISPAQHQIHHSSAKTHLDKNFGASLAIWDKMFGSWVESKNQQVKNFGLYRQANRQSLKSQLWGIGFKN